MPPVHTSDSRACVAVEKGCTPSSRCLTSMRDPPTESSELHT